MLSCTASLLDSVTMSGLGEGLWLGLDMAGVNLCSSWACATHIEHSGCLASTAKLPPAPTQSCFLRLKEGSQLFFFLEGHLLSLCFPLSPNSNCPGMVAIEGSVLGAGPGPGAGAGALHGFCCGIAVSGSASA